MQRLLIAGAMVVAGATLLGMRWFAADDWFLSDEQVVEARQAGAEAQQLAHSARMSQSRARRAEAAAELREKLDEYENEHGDATQRARQNRDRFRAVTFYGGVLLIVLGGAAPFVQGKD